MPTFFLYIYIWSGFSKLEYFKLLRKLKFSEIQQIVFDSLFLLICFRGQKQKREKPLAFLYNKQFALIDNHFKLYGDADGLEFYNLKKDQAEQIDISALHPDKFNSLQTIYQNWLTSVQNSNANGDY